MSGAASTCPSCGAEAPPSARFCPSCGAPLEGSAPKGALSRSDELHQVTVMFPDVVGSTALGERLSPEEIKALIGECVTMMVRAVEDHGGYVESYQGDGICAIFGLPQAHEDDPERAASAALRILDRVRTYAEDVRAAWSIEEFNVRIGINTGPAVVGAIGASDPHVAALGDTTNTAARLQGQAAPGTAIVGEATAARLAGRFVLSPVGPFTLKGKAEPVPAFRLEGPVRAPASPDVAPLVGRPAELERLGKILEDLRAGRGQVLSVIGEAGIGKSRLVGELQRLAGEGITWLSGRCLSYGDRLTYWPFIEMLRTWLEVAEGEADVAVRLRLKARLAPLVGEGASEVLPYLARLLSVRWDDESEERLSRLPPEGIAEQLHRGYGAFVEALARAQPTILLLEDLHWADPSTRALAESLLPLTERAPLLLASAFRSEPDTEAARFRVRVVERFSHRAHEIALTPLDPADATDLASALLSGAELEDAAMRALIARAEGNPLYLEQIIRSVVEGSDVERRVLIRVSEHGLASLPPALEGLLVSRIDRLPAGARRLAQFAAVAGRSFLRRVLEMVAGPNGLDDDLSVLLRADLIREHRLRPETEYIFTHGLIQEAAASTLTRARVRELHGLVAHALEEVGAGSEEYAEVIAHHYTESAESDKALSYLELAGARAASLYANAQAIDAWDRAISIARERKDETSARRITEKLASLLYRMGSARSVELYRELADGTTDPIGRGALLAVGAWAALDTGQSQESSALVARGLAIDGIDISCRVALLHVQARAAWRAGNQLARMASILEEVERIAPGIIPVDAATDGEFGLERAIRHAYLWSIYYDTKGDRAATSRWESIYVALAERTGNPLRILDARHDQAYGIFQAGSLTEAAALLRGVYDEARGMGYERILAHAGENLLHILGLLGEIAAGLRLGEEMRAGLTIPGRMAIVLPNLAEIESLAGDDGAATRDLREAIDDAHSAGLEVTGIEATISLTGLELRTGGPASLVGRLEEALEAAEVIDGAIRQRALACRSLAEASLRAGDSSRAEAYVRRGLDAAAMAEPSLAVPLWRLLGRAQEGKEPGSGRESLDRALELATSMGMRLEIGRVLAERARAGLVDEPTAAFDEAARIFEQCGSKRDLAELRRSATG